MLLKLLATVAFWTYVTANTGVMVYPHFDQCDPRWANDTMGAATGSGHRATICREGCAMTSLAMALSSAGVELPDSAAPLNPKTLNAWLIANGGYRCDNGDCDNLVLDAPDVLSMGIFRLLGEWGGLCCGGETAKPPASTMQSALNATDTTTPLMAFIAHVRNGTHFVLVTHWDANEGAFGVHDPFYPQEFYAYGSMGDIITYEVLPIRSAVVPHPYRLFKQWDFRWSSDTMIWGNTTVAQVGCLMSSTSMALNGHAITIPSPETPLRAGPRVMSDPGSLNAWLKGHHGYVGRNDMVEASIPAIDPSHIDWSQTTGPHHKSDISFEQIQVMLRDGQPVIANVLHGRHFVLVVGWDIAVPSTLYVNDPGFYRVSYDWEDVVGWRLFNMSQAQQR